MKDVTKRYMYMIDSFNCDFELASDINSDFSLEEMQEQIENNLNLRLIKDIELLSELSFNLRHGYIKMLDIRDQEENYV